MIEIIYQIEEKDIKELGYLMNYLNSTGLETDKANAKVIENILKNIIGLK